MKKLLLLCLCLGLTAGCVPRASRDTAATPPAAVTAAPTLSATEAPTAPPTATAVPERTYSGVYFRFRVPGDWLRAQVPGGVYFYPDPNDTQHTFLVYQEAANDLRLTETTVDIALRFSSQEAIAAMVEEALIQSGMTNFSLAPLDIEKTELNGNACYHGASDVTVDGETYRFEGHVFLRGSKLILLIYVGDGARFSDALTAIYDSLEPLP